MEAERGKARRNPRDDAGFVSMLLFWWTVQMFRDGYKKALSPEDLCQPRIMDQSHTLGNALEREWRRQEARMDEAKAAGRKYQRSLRSAIWRTFGAEYLHLGFLVIISDVVLRVAQPQLLGGLLAYFNPDNKMPREHAFGYAGGLVACAAVSTICYNHYVLGAFHMGMRVRAACCAVIYRKTLRLSQGALGRTAAGQMVNLLSNDVSRFDLVAIFLHYMWAAPLSGVFCAYFMYKEIGWPAFVGIAAVFVVVPLQAYTGHLSAKFRHKTAVKTDERVRLMDEIVSGIQVIKMYAWEKPFANMVALARKLEIRVVTKTSYIRGLYMTFGLCTTRVALAAALLTMVLSGRPLYAAPVFVVLSYFNILSQSMSMMFVRGIAEIAETLVSIRRLQDFMCHDELNIQQLTYTPPEANGKTAISKDKNDDISYSHSDENKTEEGWATTDDVLVSMEKVTARWDDTSPEPTLARVDLTVLRGRLVAVVGHVGAGKSSLLHALLGELPVAEGTVAMRGRAAYAAQEPWVFAATIRQNILFGRPFEKRRYERVVHVCALQRDLEQLPRGDMTVVGQRGAALSGGQKARINLARAVYTEAPIYILDDPLSAVDAHVGKHLFDECICEYLTGKTRILVTHQLQHLKDADHIIVMNNGRVEMQGDFPALARMVDYAELLGGETEGAEDGGPSRGSGEGDEQPEAERAPTPIHQLLRQISTRSRGSSDGSELSTASLSVKKDEEMAAAAAAAAVETRGDEGEAGVAVAELSSKGRIQGKSVYLEYFRAGGSVCASFVVLLLFLISQLAVSVVDWFVSYWTTQEEIRRTLEAFDSGSVAAVNSSDEEEMWTTEPPTTLFPDALNASEIHSVRHFELQPPPLEASDFALVFLGAVAALFVVALARSLGFYTVAMSASQRLHAAMFNSVLRARMRFFDTNPSGRILNRFSKDIGAVDELLPKAILDAGQIVLLMLGCVAVSISTNYYFAVPVVVMGSLFWFDRKIYLKTSKNVKRVEGITKSPVFTHLHATLQGLTTVRSAGTQSILRDEFDRHQDVHSSAWYMFMATSAAFGFSLDVLVLLYITIVTFTFVVLADTFGGEVGLAITQAMALTGMMQWGMRQSAEVANNMMSVERVLEYSLLEAEPCLDIPPARPAPKGWPWRGELRFEDVYLRYAARAEPVLRGLSLRVAPGEKVGVVGRTGAGKSSLIAALFRLAYSQEGRILIDGEDTATLALGELRARLSIIPQDPVLFSGTLRRNLDPFDEFPDYVLWRSVEEVELRDATQEPVALDAPVAEGGSNFSVGQRQLVCLARAILRNNRVLVLDEATANVDPHTDSLIQRTIRAKFRDCTVLTVAHRLNTIMDSDKVLVMDSGQMVEFDHPHILLQNRNGHFYSLVQETGRSMADQLAIIAEDCYLKKQENP